MKANKWSLKGRRHEIVDPYFIATFYMGSL